MTISVSIVVHNKVVAACKLRNYLLKRSWRRSDYAEG